MDFDAAFDLLVDPAHEGGYSNDPADPGGETMYGITARVARANGYTGAMRDLPRLTAKTIARAAYWTPAHCDELPDVLRFDVFDAAYNTGVHEAIVLLQRALGLNADGWFGPQTAAAIAASADHADVVVRRFNGYRLRFYTALAGWPHDGRGWANRVADNLIRS